MSISKELNKIAQSIKTSSAFLYKIPMTTSAFSKVMQIDENLVGTPDYMGLAYFWAHSVKHYLRDATPAQRKRIHDALLKAGKNLVEDNPDDVYMAIVEKGMRTK